MVATLLGSESPRVNKNLGGTKDFLTGPKDDLFVSKLVVVAAGSDGLHPPPSAAGPSAAAGPSSAAEGGAEGGAAGVGGASGAGGAAGTSGAAGAGLQVVERGPDLTAGMPAPTLLVRAVMDGQDGTDGRRPCRTCNPTWWHLQPYVVAPATLCGQPATPCDAGSSCSSGLPIFWSTARSRVTSPSRWSSAPNPNPYTLTLTPNP